ncbi:hypothetical protein Daus18300_009835 [Diaporthe australafricana]|uniref:F-box domain-containing protein n=1 Tax=Diaporthe australafricana TaxID=127596 RepID=A0ABR3WCJ5_9PEZI
MAANGMVLRSGRVVGAPFPPPPPPPVPPPPPAGPLPLGLPMPFWLMGLPRNIREVILQSLFQGLPRVDLGGHQRPPILGSLCLASRTLKAEATEAYLRARPFSVTVLTAIQDHLFPLMRVNYGQNIPVGPMGANYQYTWPQFRSAVRRAQQLYPYQMNPSWGWHSYVRICGEFPMEEIPTWLQNAGPFIRDIRFDVVFPLRAFEPMVPLGRRRGIAWGFLGRGSYTVRVGPGANMATQTVVPVWPPPPVPMGLQAPPHATVGMVYPFQQINAHGYNGQCQRADLEATRLRQLYLTAGMVIGVPGFTGFDIQDLRSIAKSWSEPSIYIIQP